MVSIVLYFGREFFVLLIFSGFFSMLLTPVANWLEAHKIPRSISSLISVIIIVITVLAVTFLLSAQIVSLVQELPKIRSEIQDMINNFKSWINAEFSLNIQEQANNLKDEASEVVNKAGSFLTGVVRGTFTFIGSFILVLVFTFLFLLHREKYEHFVIMLHKPEKRKDAEEVLANVSRIAHHYLGGRIIAIVFIAILLIIGFLIIGLKNGIILAAITALVAIIPYVGPLIGGLLPFSMALVEGSFSQAIEVAIVVLIVNVIDHYLIEPYVVGGSVRISPLFTILVLVVGGVLWGIAGIILFLPLTGILKIIFENVEGLHPYAYLIGNGEDPSTSNSMVDIFTRIFRKRKTGVK
jgi:predicted PurR-regulated permease PerM